MENVLIVITYFITVFFDVKKYHRKYEYIYINGIYIHTLIYKRTVPLAQIKTIDCE